MGALVQQHANWINVSQGKMVNRQSGVSIDGWNGHVTSIKKREGDYSGEPKVDVILGMADGRENVLISFNAESPYARGFFARIEKCDLSQPIDLGVLPWDDNGTRDKAVSLCYIRQDGTKIEPISDFANSSKVKVGSKTVSDWSSMNTATDEIVARMQSKLIAQAPAPAQNHSAPEPQYEEEPPF